MKNKKTLILIGAVVALIIVGAAVFFMTQRGTQTGQEPGEGDEGFFSFLFPSSGERPGGALPTPPPDQGPGDGSSIPAIEGQPGRNLIQLTNFAVSGASYNNALEKIRYFEKSNGYLYEINSQGTEKNQLSITTIPKIFKVHWLEKATTTKAILEYPNPDNNQEKNIYIADPLINQSQEIAGTFLPLSSVDVSVSPKGNLFYLVDNGNLVGAKTNFENTDSETIFFNTFTEFLSDWPQEDTITLQTKPSYLAEGYLYKLNPNTQTVTKVLGDIKGLTTLYSPFKDMLVYSESTNKALKTMIWNDEENSKVDFSYKTLPEKCMWSRINENKIYCAVPKNIPSANYPDDWYKGLISFEDDLWQIDLVNGETKLLLNQGGFDIINIFTNDSEDYIFFQNKKDGTLWSLNLGFSD